MNIPLLLLVLLLGHVLGDFYCQWNYMAAMKKTNGKWLIAHGFVYAVCIAAALLILVRFGGVACSRSLLWIFVWVSLSHIIIDFFKSRAIWEKLNMAKWLFSIDQFAHFVFLFLAWYFWGRQLMVGRHIYVYAHHLTVALGLLVLLRPVGLLLGSGVIWTFSKPEAKHLRKSDIREEAVKQKKDSSRLIGYLERIIVFFLLLNGEYSAIALVIAAKSIARFPEIKDEKGHLRANDYIIGTFLSLTAVIAVTVLLGLFSN